MKKVFSFLGMLVGVAIIIAGIYRIESGIGGHYSGSYTYDAKFGADYYTDQYEATQNAANNIDHLGDYLDDINWKSKNFNGLMVCFFGGVVLCYFGCIFADELKQKNPIIMQAAQPVMPAMPSATETSATVPVKTEVLTPKETVVVNNNATVSEQVVNEPKKDEGKEKYGKELLEKGLITQEDFEDMMKG